MLPDKADGSGFKFRHETLAGALAAILGTAPAKETRGPTDTAPGRHMNQGRRQAAPSQLGKAVPVVAKAMAGFLSRPPKL